MLTNGFLGIRNGEGVSPEDDREMGGAVPGCRSSGLRFGERGLRLAERSGDSGPRGEAEGPGVGVYCGLSSEAVDASEYGWKDKIMGKKHSLICY